MNLKERIAKAREAFDAVTPTEIDVEVGGELTKLAFKPVWGEQWAAIVAVNPPRPGAEFDEGVGYNTDAVASVYPLDAVTVDGEAVDEEDWQDLLSVLSNPGRRRIATLLYGLNHVEPMKRLVAAAGKASEGSEAK